MSHVWVSTMNGPEFLDAFRASNCFWTAPPARTPQSIIESRSLFSPAQDHLALIRTDF